MNVQGTMMRLEPKTFLANGQCLESCQSCSAALFVQRGWLFKRLLA
jgi:hypothetical protein